MSQSDLEAVRQLCQMQITARRLGLRIVVYEGSDTLRELISFVGLADVLLTGQPPD